MFRQENEMKCFIYQIKWNYKSEEEKTNWNEVNIWM